MHGRTRISQRAPATCHSSRFNVFGCSMLKWLKPVLPQRTSRVNLTTILLDHGSSKIIFRDSLRGNHNADRRTKSINEQHTNVTSIKTKALVFNSLPPAPFPPSDPNSANSSLCPPFHIHLKEDETFHVLSGTAKFLFLDQRQAPAPWSSPSLHRDGTLTHLVPAGSSITILRGQIHTFRNASVTERLDLEFGFSSSLSSIKSTASEAIQTQLNAKMHAFFLNTQLYRADCTKQHVPRSLLQVLLFNHHADVVLIPGFLLAMHKRFPRFRGIIERPVAAIVGRVMNMLGGVVVGQWVCGLKAGIAEYMVPASFGKIVGHIDEDVDRVEVAIKDIEARLEFVKKAGSGDLVAESTGGSPLICSAWKTHEFDGQDESWRRVV